MTRTFELKQAARERTPLLLGFVGPSSSGKTYSALRVATGIQRVVGGDIHVIDTESRRALHYAPKRGEAVDIARGKFDFKHLPFGAPFSPLDYLAALEHCVKNGARTVVVDSASHEHEGVGGVLEMQEAELTRMAGTDYKKRERMAMLAWQKPKAQRRKLINAILQMDVNVLLCFRAKPKLKLVKGQEPIQLGYQPIAASEFIYEMLLKFLFLPGNNGVPVLQSEYEGEQAMIKIPGAFREMFREPRQLSEQTGVDLATWAAGGDVAADITVSGLVDSYAHCSDPATFRILETQRQGIWARASKDDKASLKFASDRAQKRMDDAGQSGIAGDGEPPEDWQPDEGSIPPPAREPGSDDEVD